MLASVQPVCDRSASAHNLPPENYMPTPALFSKILAATRVRDITDLLSDFDEHGRIAWKPVGGNDNNLAIINLGSDPAAGVIERITNAFDAILELEWIERGQPAHLMSPRSAVEQWLQIRDGRLATVEDLRDRDIQALAKRITVTLRDSERVDRPTIDIRDAGIGLKAEDFGDSILSLNKSRKLRKLFLAGAFGQGGSTALAYSHYTLIVSREKAMSDGSPGRPRSGPVAFTLVRFNSGDALVDKHGLYEYMVDHATGHPFTFPVPDRDFSHGTLVRHVSMDLSKYRAVLTSPTGSLWWLVHNYLFDPVLPLRMVEERTNSGQGEARTAGGNYRLLTRGDKTEYQRVASLTFRDGTVNVSWWVLSADGSDSARDRITQYVQPSKPIIVTYNGQKQGDFSNSLIKTDLRLPYLERYLVVHVDCDKLDNESRRQLFPTTREALRDTGIGEELKRLILDTLSGDETLHRLDRERKQRYMSRVDSASVENIRRRLATRVRNVMLAAAGGRGPRVLPPPGPDNPTPRPAIPMQEPPTLLEITSPSPRRVYAGKRFTINFKTDADAAYFLNPDTFIAIIDPPGFGQYSGTTNVRDGYGTAYFLAADDMVVGTTSTVTLEVRPRRAASLRASVPVEVVALPEATGTGSGRTPTPNINPIWVIEGDRFWIDNSWNPSSVAKVVQSDESVEVYVSAGNTKLNNLITRAQRRATATVDTIKDFYLEHIAFFAMLAALDTERARPVTDDGTERPAPEQDNERELQRGCETICGVAEDMFEVIANRSEEEAIGAASINDDPEAEVVHA